MAAMLITRKGMPENSGKNAPDASTPVDEIPWAAIYHKAREIMEMSDDEFWNTSPRKYFALLNEALIFRGIKKAPEPVQYMDDFF